MLLRATMVQWTNEGAILIPRSTQARGQLSLIFLRQLTCWSGARTHVPLNTAASHTHHHAAHDYAATFHEVLRAGDTAHRRDSATLSIGIS